MDLFVLYPFSARSNEHDCFIKSLQKLLFYFTGINPSCYNTIIKLSKLIHRDIFDFFQRKLSEDT